MNRSPSEFIPMSGTALFVRHQTRPGMREQMQRIWEKHVMPRVQANPAHAAYFFCHDDKNPDVVCVFQLYQSAEAMNEFLAGDWYPQYLGDITKVVVAPPQLSTASLVWAKTPSPLSCQA